MRRFRTNKLWTDKTIAMRQAAGLRFHIRRLDDTEFDAALRAKMLEEAHEIVDATSADELQEEIADVLRVIEALCTHHKFDMAHISKLQQAKTEE